MVDIAEKSRNDMLNRLARIEGQVRGIQKLIREGGDCELVIQQMSASRKAFDKAFQEMLEKAGVPVPSLPWNDLAPPQQLSLF